MRSHLTIAFCASLTLLTIAAAGFAAPGDATAKLLPLDVGPGDHFGTSVALRGSTVVVGTWSDNTPGSDPGFAWVLDATSGQPLVRLEAADGTYGDNFGWSVATTGTIALVGARRDNDLGQLSGSAYLFDLATGQQIAKLLPTDSAPILQFGSAVAADGDLALVGAPFDDDQGSWSGSAYLFDASSGALVAKLLPDVGVPYSNFGLSVALRGTIALIGSQGKVYVFDATTGAQRAELHPPPNVGGNFGVSLALDGTLAVVGAPSSSSESGVEFTGAAVVFDLTSSQPVAVLRASDSSEGARLGGSVGISGTTVVAGAARQDDDGPGGLAHTGSGYFFDALAGEQIAKLRPRDLSPGDDLGSASAIDGSTVVVGAWRASPAGPQSGAAYLFDASQALALPFCFGAGSGTACPCGNSGAAGHGCANSAFAEGARLTGAGFPVVSADDFVLEVEGSRPVQPGLFLQGDDALGGGFGLPFGDGLQCVGGNVLLLQNMFANSQGNAASSIALAATAGLSAGDTKRYQWWFRDPGASPCGTGFNTSNALEVIWGP